MYIERRTCPPSRSAPVAARPRISEQWPIIPPPSALQPARLWPLHYLSLLVGSRVQPFPQARLMRPRDSYGRGSNTHCASRAADVGFGSKADVAPCLDLSAL